MKKLKKECGANLTEYALLALLIAVTSMVLISSLSSDVSKKFSNVASGVYNNG